MYVWVLLMVRLLRRWSPVPAGGGFLRRCRVRVRAFKWRSSGSSRWLIGACLDGRRQRQVLSALRMQSSTPVFFEPISPGRSLTARYSPELSHHDLSGKRTNVDLKVLAVGSLQLAVRER